MPLPGWQEFLEKKAEERRLRDGGIAIDFACSPLWAGYYEGIGLRTGYPRAYYETNRRPIGDSRKTAASR